MIGLAFYSSTQTTLDLNGPFLRFTSEPDSETVNDGGSVTLTGIATAEFKHNPTTIPGERVTNTERLRISGILEVSLLKTLVEK